MSKYTEAAQQAHKDYAERLKPGGARDFVLGMDYVHAMLHHFMEDLPETSERHKAFRSMVARLTGERGRIAVAKAGDLLPSGIAGKVDTARFPGKPDAWQLNIDVPEPTAAKKKKKLTKSAGPGGSLVITEETAGLKDGENGGIDASLGGLLPTDAIISLTNNGIIRLALLHSDHPGEAAFMGAAASYLQEISALYDSWHTEPTASYYWTTLTVDHLPLAVLYNPDAPEPEAPAPMESGPSEVSEDEPLYKQVGDCAIVLTEKVEMTEWPDGSYLLAGEGIIYKGGTSQTFAKAGIKETDAIASHSSLGTTGGFPSAKAWFEAGHAVHDAGVTPPDGTYKFVYIPETAAAGVDPGSNALKMAKFGDLNPAKAGSLCCTCGEGWGEHGSTNCTKPALDHWPED